METNDGVTALNGLGFSRLEAEAYMFLLRESPVTAYRIAQALHRPAANVYKIVEALAHKGAVIVDEGRNRMVRAVPYEELLSQLTHQFTAQRDQASRALAAIGSTRGDERVYQLATREQVIERARQMLARADREVLLIAFPGPLAELIPWLEQAAARGIAIVVKTYGVPADAPKIAGCELHLSSLPVDSLAQYAGEELHLVADATEHLLALLRRDGGLIQAIWSSSLYLSLFAYNALSAEISLTELGQAVIKDRSRDKLLQILRRARLSFDTLGHQRLLERHG